jgi:transcriptional regulator with XRE-family HTH domain
LSQVDRAGRRLLAGVRGSANILVVATAGSLITEARQRAGISQAELARRADMPRSVVNAYERGKREPGAAALDQLLEAAGMRLELAPRRRPRRGRRFAGRLVDVLDLADALPQRHKPRLAYPPLAEHAR